MGRGSQTPHLSLRIFRQAAVGEGGRKIDWGGAETDKISVLQSANSHPELH